MRYLYQVLGLLILITGNVWQQRASTATAAFGTFIAWNSNEMIDRDIRGYGAVCDGVHNDTAAIQAAIDSGARVVLPPGVCVVSPPSLNQVFSLLPHSDVWIQGSGMGISTLKIKNGAGNYDTVFGPTFVVVSSLILSDVTIDQNTENNPVDSTIMSHARFVIATGGGGNALSIERVEIRNISSVNTIYSGTPNSTIMNSQFVSVGGGTVYHDHSTLYMAADNTVVTRNSFVGTVNGPGSATAIETHGARQNISMNVIDGYETGMNITGIAPKESGDITVSGNIIKNAYHGIQLWSSAYRDHTIGFGIAGANISGNIISLNQTRWNVNPVNGAKLPGNPSGIMVDPNSNLQLRGVVVAGNQIEYELESLLGSEYNTSGTGIGYWDATNVNSVQGFSIVGNTILNANISGIRMSVSGRDIDISHNRIVNAGSSPNEGLIAAYRAGVFVSSGSVPVENMTIRGNLVSDDQATSRIAYGVEIAAVKGSQVRAEKNTFYIADNNHRSLRKIVDCNTDSVAPTITGTVTNPTLSLALLPAYKAAVGSWLVDVPGRRVWEVSDTGKGWRAVPYAPDPGVQKLQ